MYTERPLALEEKRFFSSSFFFIQTKIFDGSGLSGAVATAVPCLFWTEASIENYSNGPVEIRKYRGNGVK